MPKAQNQQQLKIVFFYRPPGLRLGGTDDLTKKAAQQLGGLLVTSEDATLERGVTLLKSHLLQPESTLFVMNPSQYQTILPHLLPDFSQLKSLGHVGIMIIDDPAAPATTRQRKKIAAHATPWIIADVRSPFTVNQILFELNQASQQLLQNTHRGHLLSQNLNRDQETQALNDVSTAVSNPSSIDELARLVLERALDLTRADTGFFLLREHLIAVPTTDENNNKVIKKNPTKFIQKSRICRSQDVRIDRASLQLSPGTLVTLLTQRACGLVCYQSPTPVHQVLRSDIQWNDAEPMLPSVTFDSSKYKIESFCSFPLRTPSDEIIGHIWLLNRRRQRDVYLDHHKDIADQVIPFSDHDISLVEAVANQAALSLDHTRLYKDLKTVFESFIQASVTAIEARDPTTSGHSERVAVLTIGLAEAINNTYSGPYAATTFSANQLYELKYAALLHDFGKIGVRESVLRKEKKLFPEELSNIRQRFLEIEKKLHVQFLESYLDSLMSKNAPPSYDDIDKIRREIQRISKEFDVFMNAILDANEPHVVSTENFQRIAQIAAIKVLVGQGDRSENVTLLNEHEVRRLSIRRGSLSPEERAEIESHVSHSYKFLAQIPWTPELRDISDIVYAHHERLDGSGYPRRLKEEAIPVQAKIMAIADIYDALVAMDRPYKKAIPPEKALGILEMEVKEGKLDPHLFQIFVEARICEHIQQDKAESSGEKRSLLFQTKRRAS